MCVEIDLMPLIGNWHTKVADDELINAAMKREWMQVGAGVAAACSGVAAYALWRRIQRSIALRGLTRVELLPVERAPMVCMSPALTTITFFSGPTHKAKEYLSRRVGEVLAANPWLGGRLEYDVDNGGKMALFYDKKALPESLFFMRGDLQVSRRTSFDELPKVLGPARCGTSYEAVGRGALLWKVSLVPDADEQNRRFALVISSNHSLMDGHTFAQVYRMLCADADVRALDPTRRQDMPAKMASKMGGERSFMTDVPPGFLLRFIAGAQWNWLFPRTRSLVFEVSDEWIAAQKAALTEDDGVPFVSTNDVVVSAFFRCFTPPCDVAMMAVNMRGKIDGLGDDAMGNYEEQLAYTPADYATPALIRKSISGQTIRRAAKPPSEMPTSLTHIRRGYYGVVTNGASFASPLTIPGATEELLLPVVDFPATTPASVLGAMAIFCPRAGKVGVAVGGSQKLVDAVRECGMLGDVIAMGKKD